MLDVLPAVARAVPQAVELHEDRRRELRDRLLVLVLPALELAAVQSAMDSVGELVEEDTGIFGTQFDLAAVYLALTQAIRSEREILHLHTQALGHVREWGELCRGVVGLRDLFAFRLADAEHRHRLEANEPGLFLARLFVGVGLEDGSQDVGGLLTLLDVTARLLPLVESPDVRIAARLDEGHHLVVEGPGLKGRGVALPLNAGHLDDGGQVSRLKLLYHLVERGLRLVRQLHLDPPIV